MKIVCEACQAKYSISDDKVRGKAFKIRCKTENPTWNKVKEHASLVDDIRNGTTSCASEGCHGPAHPFSKVKP